MNHVGVSIDVNESLYHSDLQSSRYIPRTHTAGPYASSGINFLRGLHTDFHVTGPVYIPTSNVSVFLFPCILASCCSLSC